jgi:acetylornithine deacetylase/succinyl-diaminopimelate desuccinylase-like protein
MPETGHDALQAATRILNAIYDQLPELKKIKSAIAGIDSPTMLVGRIDGGTNTNVVPGKVVLKMDRRMIPEEDPAAVEAQVRAMIEKSVRGMPGITLDIKRLLLSHALRELPGTEKAGLQPAAQRPGLHRRDDSLRRARRYTPMRACTASTWHPGGAVRRRPTHGAGIERQESRRAPLRWRICAKLPKLSHATLLDFLANVGSKSCLKRS